MYAYTSHIAIRYTHLVIYMLRAMYQRCNGTIRVFKWKTRMAPQWPKLPHKMREVGQEVNVEHTLFKACTNGQHWRKGVCFQKP